MRAVDFYIQQARSGDLEESFHGLRELDHDSLPAMQEAFLGEDDPIVLSLLVEAIWQHRQPSVIGFLAGVLQDRASEVWKQALDGLVALACPASMGVLQSAADDECDAERLAWIEEAIGQCADAIERR